LFERLRGASFKQFVEAVASRVNRNRATARLWKDPGDIGEGNYRVLL
jgi:hypothetical protein